MPHIAILIVVVIAAWIILGSAYFWLLKKIGFIGGKEKENEMSGM